MSRITTTAYNNLGQVSSITDTASRVTSFTYDAEKHTLTQTNAAGKVNTFTYNDNGWLTSHTDPLTHVISYGYDNNGNKTSFTDGRSKVTTYSYSVRNELSSVGYPDSTSESYAYLATGQMGTHIDGRSITSTASYNDAGQMTGITYPTGTSNVTFSYDNDGRKTGMIDGTGSTTYAYDNASRLTGRTTPQGTVNYAYDDAGRVSSRTLVGTGVTTYAYDTAGRVNTVTDSSDTITYTYDAANRPATTTLPNGTIETKTYFTNGDLQKIETKKGATVVSSFAYTYDTVGRKATETLASGQVVSFGYDDAGQLTSEGRAGTSGYGIVYTYDNAGNRLTKVLTPNGGSATTENYTYDDANKLLTAGSKSYTYDSAGNTKTVTTGTNVTTLNWDAAERLTGITYPSSSTNSFTYNGLSQRVGKVDSTGTYSFTLAGDNIDAKVLKDGAAIYRQGVDLIGEVRSSTKRYYNSDSLGSTRAQADSTGTVAATKETDAFGNVWTPGTTGTSATPFGFAGQHGYQSDSDSGLMRLGYRYYDSSTGRFLSRDSIRQGNNWYVYCSSDPLNAVDPTGNIIVPGPKPRKDPKGAPVVVWPDPFNHHGNAETYGGVIHFTDEETYQEYLQDPKWQVHEHQHIEQEHSFGSTALFLFEIIVEYIEGGDHNSAPLEIDANNVSGMESWNDPWEDFDHWDLWGGHQFGYN